MAGGELEALQVARCGAVVPKSADVLAAATAACRVRAMRRISLSCGQARSCWVFPRRNGGTRTRGLAAPSRARCQLRHIPKPSPSSPGAEAPMGQKGGWRRRTPAGTRTRIDGFGDRRACHCTTDAKGGVHDAMRAAARPSGRKTRSTLPESPEPDSNRRPGNTPARAGKKSGRDGPSHRFFQCMMRVCPHGCLVRRATGGTVWWSRRDSNPRPSRCERDALPLRHGPMPAPTYAGRADRKRSHSGGGVTPLVPPAGLGPATPTLGGWRSIP